MPRGFHFELQAVLEQRERIEKERQGEVARIQAERLAIETRIRAVQQAMADGRRQLRDALEGRPGSGNEGGAGPTLAPGGTGAVQIGAARLAANASLHDMVRLQRCAIELAGVHQKLSAARQRLLKASVDRKAVEMLRARRYQEYLRRQNALEAAELDDLVVMRAGRADDPTGLGERARITSEVES